MKGFKEAFRKMLTDFEKKRLIFISNATFELSEPFWEFFIDEVESSLNDEQKEAVINLSGMKLVMAALDPGSMSVDEITKYVNSSEGYEELRVMYRSNETLKNLCFITSNIMNPNIKGDFSIINWPGYLKRS